MFLFVFVSNKKMQNITDSLDLESSTIFQLYDLGHVH